ncbi:transcriptional regulator [Halomonas citrativorans]|uniref:Helix-turn-helix domain-containing protein n=1 Tax=Halomonas citrativorans TaxID=2742612 RepID=A0ABR9F9S4_9GAMM|nr:Cro/CI family transcriptional regulator [Halomonas citrativorans]MBE0403089.1 helix-turn-helix domain-containing protein [Halomonas citrativorans]
MKTIFSQLVDHFGGQQSTAKALGVNQGAVSNWVNSKHGMSPAVALRAEKLTDGKFTAAQLCPSVFNEPPVEEAAFQ